MKSYLQNIQTLLIIVLVVVLLLQRSCSGGGQSVEPEVIVTIETKWDTVKVTQTEYVPKWKTKVVTEYDTVPIPINVDTLGILKDYYSKYYYKDTLTLDTLGFLVLSDTVTMNRISNRSFTSNIKIPTTTITKEIYLNKRELYWGLGVQGKTDQLNYLGGEFLYKTKNKQIYGLGIGVNQDFTPVLSGRMYWNIGK
tara:strand:+ start:4043 stop:4630 length:588 start_codon:yes stop_codon:yes gene_type:complete